MASIINTNINSYISNILNVKNTNPNVEKNKDIKIGLQLALQKKILYPQKSKYNSVIPLNIYQTWWTKDLPPLMRKNVNAIIQNNPAFKHHLFDDNDCRNFIKNNFDEKVLNAYDTLIPGAYKADLWRYCILYKNGGIYLDIKYKPHNGFKFINLTEKEHWVLDADKNGVYNALMVCKPNNPILLQAINRVVENVRNRYYGSNCLQPTGPLMLADFFCRKTKNNFDMKHEYLISIQNKIIFLNKFIVFKSYHGYSNEQSANQKTGHYSSLWSKRQIYN